MQSTKSRKDKVKNFWLIRMAHKYKGSLYLSQILPDIRLPKRRNTSRILPPHLRRRLCRNPKPQRHIPHGINHAPLMLHHIIPQPPNVRLEHVIPVYERHLPVPLDPDFVPRVWGDDVEGGDVEFEFSGFGEFAEAGADGEEGGAGDGGGEVGDVGADVVDAVFLEAEGVRVGWAVDEVGYVAADAGGC
ncbi:hypothetical protein ABW19_dt0206632 [Dactylella cylindrospora]|nr:hypothetical protein ABW19_dt0206632 [Dactylella cylindrospora]